MPGTMLITGATGVVGHELLAQARTAGWEVVGTSRRGGDDVVAWEMNEPAPASLRRSWDVVVHTAARPRWTMPADDAWRANVGPVTQVAELVGPGTQTLLLSTAYVTGRQGTVESPELGDYRNTYEWSKAGAERLVRELIGPTSIIRPPLVVGSRTDGSVARFTGLYTFLGALTGSQLPALIADPEAKLEVVSTTDIALRCLQEAEVPITEDRIVTLGRGAQALSVLDTLHIMEGTVNAWRAARGIGPLPWPPFVSGEAWERLYRPLAARSFGPRQLRVLELLEPFIPYLTSRELLPVTDVVYPMDDCLVRCAHYWLDTHANAASRDLKPWSKQVEPRVG